MMRIFARLMWIVAFVLATYCWMVIFEHGFAWKGFSEGFSSEWRNLAALITSQPAPQP